jgi:hypothetical protein
MFTYGLQQSWVSVVAANHAHDHQAFSLTSQSSEIRRPYREVEGCASMSPEICLFFQCRAPRTQLGLHTPLQLELTIWEAQIVIASKRTHCLYHPRVYDFRKSVQHPSGVAY